VQKNEKMSHVRLVTAFVPNQVFEEKAPWIELPKDGDLGTGFRFGIL
jgi:hypothetical protein